MYLIAIGDGWGIYATIASGVIGALMWALNKLITEVKSKTISDYEIRSLKEDIIELKAELKALGKRIDHIE
jgi:hypothetical protein